MNLISFIDGLQDKTLDTILAECALVSYKPTLAKSSDAQRDIQLKILLDLFVIYRYISQNFTGNYYYKYIYMINDLINSKMEENGFRFTKFRKSDQVRGPFIYVTSIVIGGAIFHCYPESVLFQNFKDCFETEQES